MRVTAIPGLLIRRASLSASSRVSGVTWPTLRRVLEEAGVQVRRNPHARAWATSRVLYVERDAMIEAVEAWLLTETVYGAARARGIPAPTLLHWMHDAGIRSGVRGKALRIPTATIDRVVAERRARRAAA